MVAEREPRNELWVVTRARRLISSSVISPYGGLADRKYSDSSSDPVAVGVKDYKRGIIEVARV